jgi:hypothetical protein
MSASREDRTDCACQKQLTVALTIPEVVAVIDALLQAEVTLPLVDARHRALQSIPYLRSLQLAIADRLEDLMADMKLADSLAAARSNLFIAAELGDGQ